MTNLRKAAKEALWAFQYHVEQTWPTDRSTAALTALRAALAAQGCYITQDITRQEYERLYPDAEEEVK